MRMNKLKIPLIIISILIIITLLVLIENFLYSLFYDLVNKTFSIIFVIFINFMFVRYIVKSVIFPGGTSIMNIIMRNEFGKVYARQFSEIIREFWQEINNLKSVYQKQFHPKSLIRTLELMQSLISNIDSYLKIYNSISSNKTLSKYMNKLSLSLTIIKKSISDSQLQEIIEEKIKGAKLNRIYIGFNDENMDLKIQKILDNLENCLGYIENFIHPKGIKNIVFNYLMNDAFGSIFEMKYRIINEFKCTEEYIMTPDKIKLETLLITTQIEPKSDDEEKIDFDKDGKTIYSSSSERLEGMNSKNYKINSDEILREVISKSKTQRDINHPNKIELQDILKSKINLTMREDINTKLNCDIVNENYEDNILDTLNHSNSVGNEDYSINVSINKVNDNLNMTKNTVEYGISSNRNIKSDEKLSDYLISTTNKKNENKSSYEIINNSPQDVCNQDLEINKIYGKISYNSNDFLKEEKYSNNDQDFEKANKISKYTLSDCETNVNIKIENSQKKNIIIICCPNGGPFEYSISFSFIHFYVKMNFDIFLWNYRGYGLSEGSANYDNMRKDAEVVFNYVKKLNRWNKIGVHGISIGGIPSCYLAGKNLVDFCIADRTFSSMELILKNFKFGKILAMIYKLFWFYKSDNTDNFIKANIPKLALCDPADTLVTDFSSLKSSLTIKYIKNKLPYFTGSILILCFDEKFDYDHFIEILYMCFLSSSPSNNIEIRNSIKKLSLTHQNLFNMKNKKSTLQKKNYVAIEMENINNENKIDNFNKYADDKSNLISYKNTFNEELPIDFPMENISDDVITHFSNNILTEICNCLSNLNSAGEFLDNCKKYQNGKKFKKFIDKFFNNLFTWGSYPVKSIDLMDKKMHLDLANESFDNVLVGLQSYVNCLNFKRESGRPIHSFDEYSTKLLNDLIIFFNNIQKKFKIFHLNEFFDNNHEPEILPNSEKNSNMLKNNLNVNKNTDGLNIGNLIPLKCGHNGFYHFGERNLIKLFLQKNNTII